MPKVSIVMPVYNSAKYLKEAINSILEQTFNDWEFIIINELGSEDGSREIIEQYTQVDDRIILVQNDRRLGISASMNVGFDMAKGEYIARMDADDISLPDRFMKQVEFMDSNPEMGMCGTEVLIFGTNAFEWDLETDKDKLSTNILFYSPSVHPTVMIRKSLIDKYNLRYNTEFKASEDYELFSRISEVSKVANIDEVLFKYRIMENNATFKNNDIGLVLYTQVMESQFKKMGLNLTDEEIKLLSPHYSMKGAKYEEVLERFINLDLLLKKILVANEECKLYDRKYLSNTLHKRFTEAYNSISWACKNYDQNKVNEFYRKSIFINEFFYEGYKVKKDFRPVVSVLMPAFNSEKYIADTIWSVLNQSYENFELLIVNEFGSDDDTVKIINMFNDERIRIIQNKERLGLAESLNLGIREANGKYIARIDADDLYDVDRLKLQVEFMEKNLEYGVCGSWQHHFGINTDWIHKPSVLHEDLKAELIYNCELCHSTLMLRKSFFIDNNLFYDKNSAAEDYELWTRAVHKFKFANLPRVLGEYRIGEDNITGKKLQRLSEESANIAFKNIITYLNMDIPKEHIKYLSGWFNEFNNIKDKKIYKHEINMEKEILKQMWVNNKKLKVYNDDSLLTVINRRWRMSTNSWVHGSELGEIFSIDDLFDKYGKSENAYSEAKTISTQRKLKKYLKGFMMFFYRPFKYKIIDKIRQQLWDLDGHLKESTTEIRETIWDSEGHLKDEIEKLKSEINNIPEMIYEFKRYNNTLISEQQNSLEIIKSNILKTMDSRVWKAESNVLQAMDGRIWKSESNILEHIEKLEKKINDVQDVMTQQFFSDNLIKYKTGEKIRIVFLFQIASFWPSWESFYNECVNDERFEVKLIFLDENVVDRSQMKTARTFLENSGLDFINMNDFDIDEYKPHIIVYQTPYDEWHRTYPMWSESIKRRGIRIVYIPYGIEISDTENAHHEHFDKAVVKNSWRVYTFSDSMRKDYKYYCENRHSVRALGIPKFDGLYYKDRFHIKQDIKEKANGRKIVLWKVHFPKQVQENGNTYTITPHIDEYLNFVNYIKEYNDLFFIFMPHPKFCDENISREIQEKTIRFIDLIKTVNNVYIDVDDDYRYSLLNSDYIIVDRSAIMIEASTAGVPILYMSNKDYYEPTTKAITPLIESYYQGSTCDDMIRFIEMIRKNEDPKKSEREAALKKCIPYFDGNSGYRIKNDIIGSLEMENQNL